MKNPLVSVLMTVYNSERYLKSSIKSILNQSFKKWELVIVDDFSTDKSCDIINSFQDNRIRLIKNKRKSDIISELKSHIYFNFLVEILDIE